MSRRKTALTRRDLLKVAGVSSLGLGLAACAPSGSQSSSGSSSGDNRGKTITVGVEAGSPNETFFKGLAPQFTKETGVQVKILGVPHDAMHQQFLSDALSGSGAYDVFTADQPWVPEFASKGLLVALDDRISATDRSDFAGSTLDTVTYQNKIYALPFLVHNLVMYYRTDLLQQAGLSGPPKTWEEYRAYAKKLTNKATGVYGTLVEGKQNGEAAIHLEAFMQQAGGDIVSADMKPSIDSAEGLAAAKLMTGLAFDDQSTPPGLLDLTDMQGLFLQGKLAMAPQWPYLYSLAKDPSQSKVVGKFAVAPSPGNPHQVSTTFSWGFAVSAGSKNQEAAWEWVKWATGTDVQAQFGRTMINPVPRKSAVTKVMADTALTEADRAAISTFAKSVEASRTIPMSPLYPQWQDAMAVAVSSIMSKTQSPEDALKVAQARMQSAS